MSTVKREHKAGLELALSELDIDGASAVKLLGMIAQASAAPEQEPVAWVKFRNGEPDYDSDHPITIMNVPGDTIGDGDSWEPVFTHADPSEVELLRAELRAAIAAGEVFAGGVRIREGERDAAIKRADAAERKLGEAVAALRKIADDDFEAGHDATNEQISELKGIAFRRLQRTARMALASASAEPAECPVCSGSCVVATTEKDHNGDAIEMRCPECEPAKGGDGEGV